MATLSNPGKTVIKPSHLAHIVLKTSPSQYGTMVSYYKTFLSADARFEEGPLTFLSYDEEHHRIAIISVPDTKPRDPKAAGLLHFAFTFNSLHDLALAYKQREANGIEPYWCVNHGPTTSMYYHDPDGNDIETQVDNFASLEEADAFMKSAEFAENPIGADFEPEELIKRLESGEDEAAIKKRANVGPRGFP
ncbi:Glyoxalase/Bleomycin resistance protein/Dihydroxybiphenyl dioxygenase [Rhexocercosporidium sp. MPI-PUGE-AT-0058]|nr:Glyoxalase/Bleomycin resistance protein/Dihydroxybiphenyl dioxygenase [Rhexocercosporidium sp. MPI-PUGE-AT-0058]